jgi:bifunctional UDP-N-acetylglucosamine pyrophosphorylase/glucosamine-1-phosphate N-acetyltransferase
VLQTRLRAAAMDEGVTMVAPQTVFLSADTKLGRDVTIEPNVVFGPGVTVEDGALIRSFSHLEGAHVGKGARVGPFARLRPGAKLGTEVHIGNFVEVKQATIEAGAKANHLSYIGDARVGEGANIGAGTITCNYDGVAKHHTDIGAGSFIGSNSSLVAPVKIGDGAYIGSGSVVTKDVPADALAVARSKQTVKEGWAKRLRQLKGLSKSLGNNLSKNKKKPKKRD